MSETSLWEVLVPCVSNEGKPFKTRHHREWDKQVRKISGGLTIMKPVIGQWTYEDKLFKERVIPVRIACSDDDIVKIARKVLKHYDQIAVMYYRVSDHCVVMKRENC